MGRVRRWSSSVISLRIPCSPIGSTRRSFRIRAVQLGMQDRARTGQKRDRFKFRSGWMMRLTFIDPVWTGPNFIRSCGAFQHYTYPIGHTYPIGASGFGSPTCQKWRCSSNRRSCTDSSYSSCWVHYVCFIVTLASHRQLRLPVKPPQPQVRDWGTLPGFYPLSFHAVKLDAYFFHSETCDAPADVYFYIFFVANGWPVAMGSCFVSRKPPFTSYGDCTDETMTQSFSWWGRLVNEALKARNVKGFDNHCPGGVKQMAAVAAVGAVGGAVVRKLRKLTELEVWKWRISWISKQCPSSGPRTAHRSWEVLWGWRQ